MEDNLTTNEKPTPPKNRCIIIGSAIEEKYKIFINYLTIAKAMKHGLKDTINEMGGLLIGNIYSDKRIDDDFLYLDIKTILPVSRMGLQKKFTFSEEEFDKLTEEVKEKFPEDRIVGWYHSHPGWGVELSPDDQDTHVSFFNADWYVLLIVESVAKDFAIFGTDKDGEKAYPSKGYVIYCDNNDDIPKMKKLVDMVEQNRERKKDKENKIPVKEEVTEEENKQEQEDEGFYFSFYHPKIIITVLSTVIVILLVIIGIGKSKMDDLKKNAHQDQGSFTVEAREVGTDKKEIFLDCDFIEETLKIEAWKDETDDKWKIANVYVKEGETPFRQVAQLIAPTPAPVAEASTPAEGTAVVSPTVLSATPTAAKLSITPTAQAENTDEAVKEKVNSWVASWKEGNVDNFKTFYSDKFSNSKTRSLTEWMDMKVSDKVFDGKPQVDIVGDITVTPVSDTEVEVKFEQYFNGAFVSNGYKILKFTRENGEWLITEEEFKPK